MADRYKILIADDEFNTRETLARYMRRSYDVDTAMDGVEAKEKLSLNRYDLVLTDLRMPGADGFEGWYLSHGRSGHRQAHLLIQVK